jgi:alpha-galactosidase
VKSLKIVLIGAGSASFGRGAIADVLSCEELREFDLTVGLIDIDEEALERMHKLAQLLKDYYKSPAAIEASTDRRKLLPGAHYIIISVALNRWHLWEKDFYIPMSHGFRHVQGENGGPGGAFHTLRSLHITIPICRDVEELCPDALLINYTNPESRVCLAINKLTKVKAVGLCHGAFATRRGIARVLGKPEEEIDLTIGGINHFHWALGIQDRDTGKDLRPEFDRRMGEKDWGFDLLTRRLHELFGYLTYPAASHTGEYLSWGHDVAGPVFLSWGIGPVSRRVDDTAESHHYTIDARTGRASYELSSLDQAEKIRAIGEGRAPLTEEYARPTSELAVPIICDIEFDRGRKEVSVNVANRGFAIANLPEDAVVEVPAMVDAGGVKPITVGSLPEALAGLCQIQISVQKLLVEAYRERSKKLLLQALLIDPVVNSVAQAEKMMEKMLWAESKYLPEFE